MYGNPDNGIPLYYVKLRRIFPFWLKIEEILQNYTKPGQIGQNYQYYIKIEQIIQNYVKMKRNYQYNIRVEEILQNYIKR